MSSTAVPKTYKRDSETDSEEIEEEEKIKWINIIFLPFQTWWQVIMLLIATTRCILGPLLMVFPIFECTSLHLENDFIFYIRYFYSITSPLYAIDTFLFLIHRQVAEEAKKKEYNPKSAMYLFLDIFSLIPMYLLFANANDYCAPTTFWPNIMGFNEFLLIYRLGNFFQLNYSHNIAVLILGYFLMVLIIVHLITCFHLLLTFTGYCSQCHTKFYDWRKFYWKHWANDKYSKDVLLYCFAYYEVLSYVSHMFYQEIKPFTFLEFVIYTIFIMFGYLSKCLILKPKVFSEYTLRSKRFIIFHSRAKIIVEEAQRRDAEGIAHDEISDFFSLIWMRKQGIMSMPPVIFKLPSFLKTDIMDDLSWPIFYHSPTFRKTSISYKRWLSDCLKIIYKQPGERFFVGRNCYSNMYYIKTGIVQIISPDDSTAPLLSITSGTILGDISFVVPPVKRKVIVRCFSYCEVYVLGRADILASLHKFPEDRRNIMRLARERVAHAKDLFNCKQRIRGKDRTEDEGLAWLKFRWWEIFKKFKQLTLTSKKRKSQLEIPPEEHDYHCAKYIGQLVLCEELKLQKTKMFLKISFPWVLSPNSTFVRIWYKIVLLNVYLALVIFPPNLIREGVKLPIWYVYFTYSTDVIYILDMLVTLVTGIIEDENETSLMNLLQIRLKTVPFILDALSTPLPQHLITFILGRKYVSFIRYNRLLKCYMIFSHKFGIKAWKRKINVIMDTKMEIFLIYFCSMYVPAHILFMFITLTENKILTEEIWYGTLCLQYRNDSMKTCESSISKTFGLMSIAISGFISRLSPFPPPVTIADSLFITVILVFDFIIRILIKFKYVAMLYLTNKDVINYQRFVSNLKKHYIRLGIHPNLLKRLETYLECHWNHYQGMEIVRPTELHNEPFDIYWKVHGQVAESIIGNCRAFKGANSGLIRNLAETARYLILPKGTTVHMFGSKVEKVTWIVNGTLGCEYQTETGNAVKTTVPAGNTLSALSVFLNRASLKTYIAATDVEILYIRVKDFFRTIRQYQQEWDCIESAKDEVLPLFDQMYVSYVKKHRNYQRKIRQDVFNAQESITENKETTEDMVVPEYIKNFRKDPESKFIRHWLLFRAVQVFLQVFLAFLRVGSTESARKYLGHILMIFRFLPLIDVIIKMFLPYYDKYGLVVTKSRRCALHYMTRGFVVDVLGFLFSWKQFTQRLFQIQSEKVILIAENLSSLFHMYLLVGYFNYHANKPSFKTIYIEMAKWMVIFIISCFYMSLISMYFCVDYSGKYLEHCWMPSYYFLTSNLTNYQMRLIQLNALQFVQSSAIGISPGNLYLEELFYEMFIVQIIMQLTYWVAHIHVFSLLLLLFRSESVFYHKVDQLISFLKNERVDKETAERSMTYFSYWWKRTSGIDMKVLINERIGAVFRQDLNYYFFKKTLKVADTLLRGGEMLERMIARSVTEMYFLADEDVVREKQLSPSIYIIHRGSVSIRRGAQEILKLSKGSIFGQLEGTNLRPLRITARTREATDLLMINVVAFQTIINEDVRHRIQNNRQSKFDFMALKKPVSENAYNSIKFILRGGKVIQLPLMHRPVSAETNKWYERWLLLAWVVFPVTSFALILFLMTVSENKFGPVWWTVAVLDIFHLCYLATDFYYTMELFVIRNRCVYRYTRIRKLFIWYYYVDVVSLLLPLLTIRTGNWTWQITRLFRSHSLYFYYKYFCRSFKDRSKSNALKITILFLLLHALTCGWILISCQPGRFPVHIHRYAKDDPKYQNLDFNTWVYPDQRKGGCTRISPLHNVESYKKPQTMFFKPTDWRLDYVMSMFCITIAMTSMRKYMCAALTVSDLVYKIFSNFVVVVIELWVIAVIMSSVYLKFREMYQFHYSFGSLLQYLKHHGVSKYLIKAIDTYTQLLWRRQKGCWLPELTEQAPLCLREDIMSSLYMHHLLTPPIFRGMPMYFLKQIAVRLKRVVYFPGKHIVQEGNISPIMYFIHEGEIEKWYTDRLGDNRLAAVLTMNDYFGIIPGLFPNTPYQHSFYTRTVADLVYLVYSDWQDILNGYPDLKYELYINAMTYRRDKREKKSTASGRSSMKSGSVI